MALTDNLSACTHTLIFKEKDVFLNADGTIPDGPTGAAVLKTISEGQIVCRIAETPANVLSLELTAAAREPAALKKAAVRECFAVMSEADSARVARARSLLKWHDGMRVCPRCGTPLECDARLTAKNCPACRTQYFPRIEPCIIALVIRDGKILLARHKQHAQTVFTCIAGFIEAGESAEHAVLREVQEETGLKIKNIRYFASQSWPYPDQLMLGFFADYQSGSLALQTEELHEAAWFSPDALPPIPKAGSMANRLIDRWLSEQT